MISQTIYNENLLGMTTKCTVCGTVMFSTGKIYFNDIVKKWFIEYWCPSDKELFTHYSPGLAEMVDKIVEEESEDQD